MMKKSNTMAAGLLLLSLTMGMAGSAAAESASEAVPKKDQAMRVTAANAVSSLSLGGVFMNHSVGLGLLGNPVHERNYLKLLVKAYTPDSEQAWNGAFEERKQAEAQFTKTLTIRTLPALPDGQLPASEAVQITTEKPLNGDSATKEIKIGDNKVHVTFIQKDLAAVTDAQYSPVGITPPDGIINGMSTVTAVASPEAKLQGDFSKAVDAGDAAAIKELLPKLLEDYKQSTAKMNESIEQYKKFQAEAGQNGITQSGEAKAGASTETKSTAEATK
jgi:hypothetical protein